EYGSAQRLLGLFTPEPGTELQASDWEQGPSAMEELRKADPALLTPIRPLGGVGLGIGRSTPAIAQEALEAIGDATEATTEAAPTPEATTAPGATDVPAGAVRGDGTATCPPEFPIKGNTQSMIYHTAESRVYGQTIAEICFSSPEAAKAAGYRSPKNV
ncbi:MAG: ribosomal protein, partial [Thermomicrobiales bacterium]|nr:ribosomal protein [Thermomicrobiales bacterium]